MPSKYAIETIKRCESEPDRAKRKLIIREAYYRLCRECDAEVATFQNLGMSTDDIYHMAETGAIRNTKKMFVGCNGGQKIRGCT